jgi:hypothetical protein
VDDRVGANARWAQYLVRRDRLRSEAWNQRKLGADRAMLDDFGADVDELWGRSACAPSCCGSGRLT